MCVCVCVCAREGGREDENEMMAWEGILVRRLWGNLSQGNLLELREGRSTNRERGEGGENKHGILLAALYPRRKAFCTPTCDVS